MSVSIEPFAQVELRNAVVKEAGRIEGTDRLLRLRIDLGSEERQIVDGIGAHYEPETPVDRTVIVVANLEPDVIRGVERNGIAAGAAVR